MDNTRCPKCGYTKEDQMIHGDHHLCTGTIPEPSLVATGLPESLIPGANWINPDTDLHGLDGMAFGKEAGVPESGENFLIAVENAYMDRMINVLREKWHLNYKQARDIGRDLFYSFVLPVYELGGQYGLKPTAQETEPGNEEEVKWLRAAMETQYEAYEALAKETAAGIKALNEKLDRIEGNMKLTQ